jgi:hypothetical protein
MTILGDGMYVQARQIRPTRQPPAGEAVEARLVHSQESAKATQGAGADRKHLLIRIGWQEPSGRLLPLDHPVVR